MAKKQRTVSVSVKDNAAKPTNVLVLGVGKVGKSVAELLLARSGARGGPTYRVTLADFSHDSLATAKASIDRLARHVKHPVHFATRQVDATNAKQVASALKGHDAAICMLPFDKVMGIAQACRDTGVHYFDVTEDVETTQKVEQLASAKNAPIAYAPQCGLAPGYIAIAAADVASRLDVVEELYLRVGALPRYPTNAIKYNVTWSADGVINEYCEPCKVMLHGKQTEVPALDGLERFTLDGDEYEAFYTSGGVGSLIDTLKRQRRLSPTANVAYKTIRYPGHRDMMKFLLDDLGFGQEHSDRVLHVRQRGPAGTSKSAADERNTVRLDRALLVSIFNKVVSWTPEDAVVIYVNAIGLRNGRRTQLNFRRWVPATRLWGRIWPAIELTTAAGVCAMVELHRLGELPATGFIRQESVSLERFNATSFGAAYEDPASLDQA
jgi:saccharopine dehydrogenase-like NADP-dependent oxidoreductase